MRPFSCHLSSQLLPNHTGVRLTAVRRLAIHLIPGAKLIKNAQKSVILKPVLAVRCKASKIL